MTVVVEMLKEIVTIDDANGLKIEGLTIMMVSKIIL
jgi:hypothetical protein